MTDEQQPTQNNALQKLLDQQAKIVQQIKQEKRKQEKKLKAVQDRKYYLVGSAILDVIKTDLALKVKLEKILDSHIKVQKDRDLLGLKEANNT